MTEIKIEKKPPVWPWILVGLVVAALIYFFAFRENGTDMDRNRNTKEEQTIGIREDNNTVNEYVRYVKTDTSTMGLDHEFTNEALIKLADATKAMAKEIDYDVNNDQLREAKDHANKITDDPLSTSHAQHIKHSSELIAMELQSMQRAQYPELSNEVSAVMNASASINAQEATLNQREAVKSYFDKTADLLEKMN